MGQSVVNGGVWYQLSYVNEKCPLRSATTSSPSTATSKLEKWSMTFRTGWVLPVSGEPSTLRRGPIVADVLLFNVNYFFVSSFQNEPTTRVHNTAVPRVFRASLTVSSPNTE